MPLMGDFFGHWIIVCESYLKVKIKYETMFKFKTTDFKPHLKNVSMQNNTLENFENNH